MNFKTTAGLFAAVVVLLVVLMIVFSGGTPKGADGLMAPFVAAGYKIDDVDTVEIVRTQPNEQKLVFVKQDKTWVLREPGNAKIDSSQVTSIVSAFFSAKPIPYKELSSTLAVHGLDRPTLKVTLRGKGNTSSTVNVGDTTIGGNEAVTFVTTADRADKAIAIRANDLRALFRSDDPGLSRDGPAAKSAKWLTDFRLRRLMGSDIADLTSGVQSLVLKRGENKLALSLNAESDWIFDAPAGYGLADTLGDSATRPEAVTGVRNLLNILTTLQAGSNGDFLEFQTADDFAKYGVNGTDPNSIRVELTPKSGPKEVLLLGKPVEQGGKPIVPAKVYARMEGDSAVVMVQTDRLGALEKLIADPSELRNRDLIAETKKDRIDAIDVTSGGQTLKLRRMTTAPETQWVVYGGSEPQYAGVLPVKDLIAAITKPRIARDVVVGTADDAFAAPSAELNLWLGGTPKIEMPKDGKLPAEPTLVGNPIRITVGRRDADITYVRRIAEGTTTVFRVPNESLASWLRSRVDYIDAKLGSFSLTTANKLSFNRGTEQIELNKATQADPLYPEGKWVFAKPDSRKDSTASPTGVDMLLTLLATTQSPKIVAESPTPEQLAAWGLTPGSAKMRVAVGLTSDTENERVYEFGTETADKQTVHFRLVGKPFVFQVLKSVADQFATVNLQDPILFRAEQTQIQEIDFRGWKGTDAVPKVIKIKRDKDSWVAVEPMGFALDAAKLTEVLKLFDAPRALEFVSPLPTAEQHGLDVNSGALDCTIRLTGGKEFVLRLGKEDASKQAIYALASVLEPGQIVKLPAAAFRGLLTGPGAISK